MYDFFSTVVFSFACSVTTGEQSGMVLTEIDEVGKGEIGGGGGATKAGRGENGVLHWVESGFDGWSLW